MKTTLVLLTAMLSLAHADQGKVRCTAVPNGSDYLRNTPGYGYGTNANEAAKKAVLNCFSGNGNDPAAGCRVSSCDSE